MIDFTYEFPVKLVYGVGGIQNVAEEILKNGNRVLLVMDGSFVSCGYAAPLRAYLTEHGITTIDYVCDGPPMVSKVREGIELCKAEKADVVMGIGGGVRMDIAKAIALGVKADTDIWKLTSGEIMPDPDAAHLPVITVVTNPMSGSEVNNVSQLTDDSTGEQCGLNGCRADMAWLNPEYTMTVPAEQLAYNGMTIFWQLADIYLAKPRCDFSEAAAEAMMGTLLQNLKKALKDPSDQDARGNLLLCSAQHSVGLPLIGKDPDWMFYPFQAVGQSCTKVPYAKTVPILYPYWLSHIYDGSEIFKCFFRNIFGVLTEERSDAEIRKDGLDAIMALYDELGIAKSFREFNGSTADRAVLLASFEMLGELPSRYLELTPEKMTDIYIDAIGGNY